MSPHLVVVVVVDGVPILDVVVLTIFVVVKAIV
jgi:hypothetical protein